MNNDIKILIGATLNTGTSIGDINSAIKLIEKKINKIKLKIEIDDKVSRTLSDYSKAMENQKRINQDLNRVLKEEKTITKELDGTIKEKTTQHLKSGEIIQREIQRINNKNKATEKEIQTTGKLISEYQKLGEAQKKIQRENAKGQVTSGATKYKNGNTETTFKTNGKDEITSVTTVQNLDQERKATEALINSKQKLRQILSQLNTDGKVSSENLTKLNSAIDNARNIKQVNNLADNLKNLNRIQENTHKLEMARQQAQLNAQKVKTSHGSNVDNSSLQKYLDTVNSLTPRTANLNQQLQNSSMQFKHLSQNAREASNAAQQSSQSFGNMFSQALTKFPIWMISAQVFYAPIQALESITTRLIEIDTLMTGIQRVMEMPDFKYTELLQDAVNVSDELSSKLTDVLTIYGEFGRMGFQANELTDITKTAQTLQNISDLTATDSVNTLVSAMLNYNIAAKDSIQIADKLNEVDNAYAISTKDLSDSIRKAASTSKTFGVELNNLIGYTTAIGSTTRESGAIVGNGLKTILSRITTMSEAESILKSVNISIRDMGGDIRPVQDILENLAGTWSTLSDEQRQNIGVTLAGRHQLSRFLALMNNFHIAQEASATAADSVGSSFQEQAKYSDSLEARLNRLDTAWNKVVISFGNAVMTDGLIAGVEALNSLISLSSVAIDKFGVLSGAFGVLGIATLALSTKFRTFSAGVMYGTAGMTRMQLASVGLTAGMTRLGIATIGVKTALRGLLMSTVVGAGFVALGFGLEKLINAMSKSKQAQEEFEQSQQKNISALTDNREQTDQLISTYKRLSEEKQKGSWSTEKEKEYLQVQQQLGESFPSLIDHIDKTGQTHLKSSEAIDKEIEATEKLLKLKQEEIKLSAVDTFKDNIEDRDGTEKKVKRLKNQYDELKKLYKDTPKNNLHLNQLEQEILSLETQVSTSSLKINDGVLKIVDAYKNLKIDPIISKSFNDLIMSLDLSKLDANELESFSIKVAKSLDGIQKATSENDSKGFNKSIKSLKQYLKETGATDVQLDGFNVTLDKVTKNQEQLANATYSGSEAYDTYTGSVIEATEAEENKLSVAEQLAGVSKSNIATLQEQIGVYQMLSEQENLSANMKTMLTNATNILSEAYPHLIDGKNLNILAMQEELDANNLLLQAVELSAEGQLSAQEQQTVNAALGAKARIEIIKQEIKALEEAQNVYLSRITAQNEHGGDDLRSEKNYMITQNKIGSLESELAKIKIPEFKGFKSKLEGIVNSTNRGTSATKGNTKSTKDNTKAKKDNKKATEESIESYKNSIYVADEFKIKLDEINAALTKQNNLKAKFASHSENYRKALREEIKLLEKQKKLTQDEAKSLSNQIKSGKIKETGVIDISNSVTSGSTKDKAPAGAYKGKYHAEINKAANTYGVDPFLIASIIKRESSFNPKTVSPAGAKGLMQLMPGTAKYLGVKNVFDPLQNIMGGTKYIAQQLAKFGGDIKTALAAYNAGPGNVAKYKGIPPFKETQDYIKKVLGYYKDYTGANYSNGNKASKASTTPSRQSQSSNAKSVADYYFNNFKITSNLGDKESFRSKPHKGTDFANGKAGSPIKAVNSGKVLVSGYSDSAGNWVVIQQDDGKVAKYMHMLKKPDVKKGQRVDAGTILGKVGNTGDSRGAHLHLQIEANGKPIDAVKYLKQLQNTVNTGVSKVTDINYPTSEKTVADQLAAIDQAKAELLELNSDVSNLEQQILDLKDQIVQSYVDEFEYKKNIQKNKVQDLENRTYHLDTSSKEYRKNLEEQRKSVNEQQRINELEIKKVKYLLSLKEITAKKREELKGTLTDLMNERYEIADKRDATTLNIINSAMAEYAERVEKVDFLLGESEYNLSNYNDTSKEYRAELERQNELLYQKDTQLFYQIQALEEYLKKEKLTTEALKEKQKELAALKEAYRESTNSLKENANAKIEWTFHVSDKSIDDAVQKIEFIEYKMSLLSDDAGLEVKSGLFDEMNNELIKVNAELETAIQQTIKLRTETAVKGGDTGIFDDRLDNLLEQRRSNVQKLKQNYQDMLSNVEEAKSKIEEAESKANEEASKQFDKLLRDTEKNINAFQKIIDKANNSIELLETDQFTRKQELLGEALLATKNKANQIIAEFNQLRNVTVYSEEDAEALRSRLEQLKQELVDTNKSTIEYVKALEQVNFDSLTHEARLADAEIERLNNRLRSNMELLDGGLLSGTDLDFSFSIPQGSSLDLASFINDPISDIETEEIRIQNIRESSYGEQIRQAEAFHEQMKQQAEQYRMSLVEAEKQFQEAIQKQIEESDKKIADAKAKADKNDKNKAKLSQKEEKQQLEQHIKDIEAAMALGLSNYSGAYSQQWDGVLRVLEQKLQEAKSKLDSLLAVEYQADNVNVPSDSNSGKKVSKSPRANGQTYVPDRKPSKSPRAVGVPAYQNGTDGHPGNLALISENGRELVVLPNGKTFVSSDNGAELVDLPKGSHVIPNEQTEMLLKSNSSPTVKNIPAYANGTWDWDRLMWDNEYWAAYLRGSDPQAYNQMMDNQNGYNSNDYYRDDQGYLIDKRDGSWVQPSYDVPYYSSDYTPPSNNYYEPSYNEPYYDYNDNYNGSASNYYPDYNPAPYVPSADELSQSRLNELRSSKATVYSDKFVSKYDPYNKYGSIYENTRKGKQTSIKGLQQQLDAIENSSNTSNIKDLTEQILNKQNELAKEDMSFLIESLTDLSEQREKNALALKEELIRELESTDMSEEMRNQYREEIMRQDDIIAQSLKERKSLVGEMFEYEKTLREKRLHMIKEDEQNIQRIIAETRLNNPDDPKLIDLNNQLLQQQAKYTGEIAKIRTELINQMKQYEVGSYEWNLLNQQLLQNEIGYQKDRLSNLDEENDKEERNLALKEKKDELEKAKKDKRFSYIQSDGTEILTYDKGKVADLEKEIADMEKQYRKDDIKEEYSKELALLEERLNNGIQMSPEQLAESQKYLDSLVEMYKKLNVKDVETKHSGGIIGDVPASPLQELVNKLFNTKPNEQIVKGQLGELMIPSKNIPNLFTNIGNLVNSIIPRNQPQAATVQHHYHFQDVTVKANNMDEFLGSLEHYNRTK